MMKKFLFILIMAIPIAFLACDKTVDGNQNDLNKKWELTKFISNESVSYTKNNNYNPTIEFKTDGTFSLKPDVNQCGGNFSITGENKISISPAWCTEMCCDSQFSQKFIEMLPLVKSFTIEGNNLTLFVPEWGSVFLHAVE